MEINTDWRLTDDQYYHDVVPKTQIYLHHTVGGSAKSTFEYWQSNVERVGTAYIIERDGTVYEVFPPEQWCHHLGLKLSSNTAANKASIGIELASEGALRSGNELNTALALMNRPAPFDPNYLYAFDVDVAPFAHAKKLYHLYNDQSKFFDAGIQFRGYGFFDLYDPAQEAAAIELVVMLCEKFGIPKQLIPQSDKLAFDESLILGFTGVLTHCNVRADKSDLCPAWDWSKLDMALKS